MSRAMGARCGRRDSDQEWSSASAERQVMNQFGSHRVERLDLMGKCHHEVNANMKINVQIWRLLPNRTEASHMLAPATLARHTTSVAGPVVVILDRCRRRRRRSTPRGGGEIMTNHREPLARLHRRALSKHPNKQDNSGDRNQRLAMVVTTQVVSTGTRASRSIGCSRAFAGSESLASSFRQRPAPSATTKSARSCSLEAWSVMPLPSCHRASASDRTFS